MDSSLDLSFLSDKERRKIQAVLERDAQMQKKEEQRLERLRMKAEKTKNPVILKKINMRSGQWFNELQANSKFKRRGVDTVRSSIRLAKSRRGSNATPLVTPVGPTPAASQLRLAPSATTLAPVIEQTQKEAEPASTETPSPAAAGDAPDATPKEPAKEESPPEPEPAKPEEPSPEPAAEEPAPEPAAEPDPAPEKTPPRKNSGWAKLGGISRMNPMKMNLNPMKMDLNPMNMKVDLNPMNMDLNPMKLDLNPMNMKVDLNPMNMDLNPMKLDLNPMNMDLNPMNMDLNPMNMKLNPFGEGSSAEEKPAEEVVEEVVAVETVVEETAPLPEVESPSHESNLDAEEVVEVQVTTPDGENKEITASPASTAGSVNKRHGSTQSLNITNKVTGSVRVGFSYNNKKGMLMVLVVSCSNLSTVEKRLPNPYVKTYLLPDKAKTSKRKTKIKKKTINPNFGDSLKYRISESELATRVLNVGIWHDKGVGYNVFLGEANINMESIDLNNADPTEYELKPRESDGGDGSNLTSYNGEVDIALRFQADHGLKTLSDSDVGQLDAVVKKVKNVSQQGRTGQCNIFIKGYFLPDRYRQTKQKSPTIGGTSEITFDHLFSYTNVEVADLKHRCLELRVFDQSKIGAHRLVGGVRVGCGSGESLDQPVDWMDSNEQEKSMWDGCLAAPGTWVEGVLDLRKLEPRKA